MVMRWGLLGERGWGQPRGLKKLVNSHGGKEGGRLELRGGCGRLAGKRFGGLYQVCLGSVSVRV